MSSSTITMDRDGQTLLLVVVHMLCLALLTLFCCCCLLDAYVLCALLGGCVCFWLGLLLLRVLYCSMHVVIPKPFTYVLGGGLKKY